MNLLNRLLGHDHWTTRQLVLLCGPLSGEQLNRQFPFGHRSVQATVEHIVRNMEVWADLIGEQPIRSVSGDLLSRLDRAASDLKATAERVEQRNAWDEQFVDVLDNPPTRKSFGGAVAHIITHSMHHRAQLISMLRALGVEHVPEGDVLSWEIQAKG